MVFSLIHTTDAKIFLSGTDRTRDNVIDLLYGEEKTSGVRDIDNTPFSQKSKLSLIGTNDNVEGSLICVFQIYLPLRIEHLQYEKETKSEL